MVNLLRGVFSAPTVSWKAAGVFSLRAVGLRWVFCCATVALESRIVAICRDNRSLALR